MILGVGGRNPGHRVDDWRCQKHGGGRVEAAFGSHTALRQTATTGCLPEGGA